MGAFVFPPHPELWGHISKTVCRNTLICTGEKQHSYFISYHFYSLTEGSPSLGTLWANAQTWHALGTCKSSTMQDLKTLSTAAKALLTSTQDLSSQDTWQGNRDVSTEELPKVTVPVYIHQVPPTPTQRVPFLSFWPLPNFKLTME